MLIDPETIKIFHKFDSYRFVESTHTYYWNEKEVKTSVTQFISRYFPEFDSETISRRYAEKHGMLQEDVLEEWKLKGDVSATAGTLIHSWLENAKRGKEFEVDFSKAKPGKERDLVEQRVNILLPKAKAFHKDTLGKLYPIRLEYTVGIQDKIAGNIDMLCWNEKAQELQIWDYKNTKEISTVNYFGKRCNYPFNTYPDSSFYHYSLQLNIYKQIIQRELGIEVGKMYLVHFDYTTLDDSFDIYQCDDLQKLCKKELDAYLSV